MDRLKDLNIQDVVEKEEESDVEMDEIAEDPTMPEFNDDVKKIKEWTNEVRENVDEIKQTYSDLLIEADTSKIKSIRVQISQIKSETDELNGKIRTELKEMTAANEAFKSKHEVLVPGKRNASSAAAIVKYRVNTCSNLSHTFKDLVAEYQRVLNRAEGKLRDKAFRQVKLVAPEADEDEINQVLDQGGDITEQFAMQIIKDRKLDTKQTLTDYLKERHNDLQDLEASIIELRTLFQDMEILVQQQGSLIDDIEYSVAKTQESQFVAAENLSKAAKSKQEERKKKVLVCIIVTFTVVYVLIVVLVIVAIIVGVLLGYFKNRN